MSAVCSIEGCGKTSHSKGWCSTHYMRWKRRGSVEDDAGQRRSPNGEPQKFLREVALTCTSDECLIWPFSRGTKGYGLVRIDGKKNVLVHRYICTKVHGESPSSEHQAAHSCGNGFGGCCNPRHVRWATRCENAQDKLGHGTHARGEKNCNNILSEGDVGKVIALKGVMQQTEIAKMFGVHKTTISDIHRGKSWFWLQPANDNNEAGRAAA